MISDNN